MAGAGGDTTALHHQVKGRQSRSAGRQDGEQGQLGPQHLLLVAAQAIDFRAPARPGHGPHVAHQLIRSKVPHMDVDRELHKDITAVAALVDELRASLSAEATVTASATAKLLYARDSWPRLSLQARAGQRAISPPDLVVHAGTVADVVEVVRAAARHSLPVVPFGAGSGVCGAAVPLKGGISLDTKRLLDLDLSRAADGLICVGAGWIGQRLEHELQRHGYTLGHFPSSIGCSTIGGYLATRSAGQYSTRFGKIEDMVVSLRFVDGEGQLRHTTEGAFDTTQLLVGSEGMLGVIVDAWLRVEPAATEGRLFRGSWCASVSQGLEAMRKALQAGHQPAVFRLYDPFDSFISGARKAEEGELLLPTDPQQWPRKKAPSGIVISMVPRQS
jgi:alkyldihydroxyacetonephosphate synthase